MKIIIVILILFVGYYSITTYSKLQISKKLVAKSEVYKQVTNDQTVTVLVLGDSTGVGVGADAPSDTVAALLAKKVTATHVENYSVSGAVVDDLEGQLNNAQYDKYNYILIQIGGNNIIRFKSPSTTQKRLKEVLSSLPQTDNLYVMSVGNVGGTTFFPWFMRKQYTNRTLEYHDMFTTTVPNYGGIYINLYTEPDKDVFLQKPTVYLAADGLHPSSAGYEKWFEKLQTYIE